MNDGFSPEGLARMHSVMTGYVDRGEVPGIVTLLSRHGETHVDAIGAQSFDGTPMQRDTIFRIASMTKPITALATMMLLEECVLRLGFWDTFSWGFGVSVVTRRTGIAAVPGRYGWDGAFNTSWGNDPGEGLTAIFMPQRLGPPLTWNGYLDFWTSTYQTLAD